MESEARPNPLSNAETIEQLRTTIDKLETIIEQLNSTSVVDLTAADSVAALISTAEELENAIAESSQKLTTTESEPTPASIEVGEEVVEETPEVSPIVAPEEPLTSETETIQPETSESQPPAPQTPAPQTPLAKTSVTKESPAQPTVAPPARKAQKKPKKSKQKKNWIAIAIVALIVAIIPISLKYLSTGSTQQAPLEKLEVIGEETIIEKAPVIATNLSDNNLPENIEKTVIPEVVEKTEDVSPNKLVDSELVETEIADIAISEFPQQEVVAEIAEVASTDLITEETETPLTEGKKEPIEPKITSVTDSNILAVNNQDELTISSESLESEVIFPLETEAISESSSKIDSAVDKTEDEIVDKITIIEDHQEDTTVTSEIENTPENIPEPEPTILVPETLVAEEKTETLELKTIIQDVKLTPEQTLIAALSDKVLQLAEDYKQDIISSIEPNITNNILVVRIVDDWYQLEATKQDEILADMFARSQKLEFRKLEIIDQNDNLVARSPVVGQNMIIFRRDS